MPKTLNPTREKLCGFGTHTLWGCSVLGSH